MNRDPRQLFIRDPVTGSIRITRLGVEQYATRFAQAGYNIRNIKTMGQFEEAVDACFAREMQQLSKQIKGQDPELDQVLQGLPGWD